MFTTLMAQEKVKISCTLFKFNFGGIGDGRQYAFQHDICFPTLAFPSP